jgi:hypothetical protein
VRVVAELGHDPGAEDGSEAGLAGVDVIVPVMQKSATTSPSSSIWVFSARISATCPDTTAA